MLMTFLTFRNDKSHMISFANDNSHVISFTIYFFLRVRGGPGIQNYVPVYLAIFACLQCMQLLPKTVGEVLA